MGFHSSKLVLCSRFANREQAKFTLISLSIINQWLSCIDPPDILPLTGLKTFYPCSVAIDGLPGMGGERGADIGNAQVAAAKDEKDGHAGNEERYGLLDLPPEAQADEVAGIVEDQQGGQGACAEEGHEQDPFFYLRKAEGGGYRQVDHAAGQESVSDPQQEDARF